MISAHLHPQRGAYLAQRDKENTLIILSEVPSAKMVIRKKKKKQKATT